MENGWYICNVNTPTGAWWYVFTAANYSNAVIVQKAWYYNYGKVIECMRLGWLDVSVDRGGGWQPWEYVNPPLQLGTEYRTTERYLGKPVYVKTVDTGALPNATYKEISASFPNANRFLAIYGSAYKDNAHLIPLPCLKYGLDAYSTDHAVQVTVNNTTSITISTKRDMSSFTTSSVCVKYTKSTD